MNIFFLKEDITLKINTCNEFKYSLLPSLKNPNLDNLYINLGDNKLITNKFKNEEKNYKELIYTINSTHLFSNIKSPMRLGRDEGSDINKTYNSHILSHQVKELLDKNKKKENFRIVLINGYGGNLGDSMIGASAMNNAIKILKKYLPNFTIDIFLSVESNSFNRNIIQINRNISDVYIENLSVERFCKYDAYFDFSNLQYILDKINIPTFDWFIWWFGLDIGEINENLKRNQKINMDKNIDKNIKQLLKPYHDKRKVFFNPKASVPLRSCPFEVASQIADKILEKEKDIYLISDLPLLTKNNRFINLSQDINSAEKFTSLVSSMDAIISVNTFSAHIADAYKIPCVTIDSTLPAVSTRYYPNTYNIQIPKASELSGWMLFKNNNFEEWLEMEDEYTKAWQQLDIEQVLKNLKIKIKEKNG